ncbi:hypothetical protein [Cognatishimia sp. F0-27]|uniref:hypothetical protein n=1 Tax=Cognatishimia sp. F0-27 TaxID=2816855 RepID=UPI001D0CB068|nr:hypothetical protein [Cognatishimia sp. F0-27]MCC1491417.1 hypothetical protein [Cognatishimia sp. F0-27]
MQPPAACLSTGQLVAEGGGAQKNAMDAPAGAYQIAAYGLGLGRYPECLILIAPLDGAYPPELTDTPELKL